MNSRDELRNEIREFLVSPSEKIMFIRGTFQNEKHKEVLRMINNTVNKETKVLFRVNSMSNIGTFIDNHTFTAKTRTRYSSGNLNIYFDSINKTSWDLTEKYNISILYPIDSICSKKTEQRDEIINDLLRKTTDKVFLVTWMDNVDYTWLDSFNIDRKVIFDAFEEDKMYHQRVLDCIANRRLI